MEYCSFEKVNVVLVEPNRQVRQSTRDALKREGFINVTSLATYAQLHDELESEPVDLLITEITLPDGDVSNLIHDLRHGKFGNNPFLPIITTSWRSNEALVSQIINSGADDILIKPLSMELLVERIKTLVHFRKPFIVTLEYIGPDRRDRPRSPLSPVKTMSVPNNLKIKSVDGGINDIEYIQHKIDQATAHLNMSKMDTDVNQITKLVSEIVPNYANGKSRHEKRSKIDKLILALNDLSRRTRGTEKESMAKLCNSMLSMVKELHSGDSDQPDKLLRLITEMAQALRAAYEGDEETNAMAKDVISEVRPLSAEARAH